MRMRSRVLGPEKYRTKMFRLRNASKMRPAAVQDQKWMKANVAKVVKTRAWFTSELVRRGWDVLPSESNFVFARPPLKRGSGILSASRNAARLFDALRARNIFVRYFKGPKTGDRLRITIGTDAQMKKLLSALDKIG